MLGDACDVIRRCPGCNGYYHRRWTWWHKFKSWTRLIAFHIALMPLGKVWIQLFSLQLWINSRADWVLQFGEATGLGEGKSEFKPVKLRLKIDLVSYHARVEGLVNMITVTLCILLTEIFTESIKLEQQNNKQKLWILEVQHIRNIQPKLNSIKIYF